MDKYSGCNIVESTVKSVDKPSPQKPKRKSKLWLVRWGISAALVGAIVFLHFAPFAVDSVRDAARKIFGYDMFGRTVGTSVFTDSEEA